ncbi:MAG: hypothetical protein H0T73_11850 [Ardenticatenales bacterium]|nr:hypothetical protein [Ardenticatenales bacterium]
MDKVEFRTLSESLDSKGSGVPALDPLAFQQFAGWQERRSGSALPSFSLAYYGFSEVATPQSLRGARTQGGRKKLPGF